jgi:hypothetical protein
MSVQRLQFKINRMNDVVLYESGNGGDVQLKGNDLATTDGFTNMPYLGWFGGNPGFVTTGNELENEQRFDWWGNSLLLNNDKEIQYNSFLENILNNTAIDSEGRNNVENFARRDLEFLLTFAEVDVDISIISDNRISIEVKLTKPDNLDVKTYQFIWDATNKELIEERIL